MKITSSELDEVFPSNPLREVAFEVRFPFNLRINYEIHRIQADLERGYPKAYRSELETDEGISKNIYVFENESGDRQIQISENDLTITFRRYDSFENYLDEILSCTELVSKQANIQSLTRIGLRYVNLMSDEAEINGVEFLQKFVHSLLDFKAIEADELRQFVVELVLQKPNCFLSSRNLYYQQAATDETPQKNVYVLDIDAFVSKKVDPAKLELIMKELHHEIQIEFLSRITDGYKEQMRNSRS